MKSNSASIFSDEYYRVLSIAGSDSGGGAGVQADIKTFAALGCYGMTAITSITSQNTVGIRSIHIVPVPILGDQIDAVVEDIGVDSVKIGMLASVDIVQAVSNAIDRHQLKNVVLDPVMVATSGAVLIDHLAASALVHELFSRATIVTPNLDEASLLVGRLIQSETDMESAAEQLLCMGARAILLKGGHMPGKQVCDLLLTTAGTRHWLRVPRMDTKNTHGTGCTLSAAIAANLAMGVNLFSAVQSAHAYVRDAIKTGMTVRTGTGNGPLNHSHSPIPMRLNPLR